MNTNNNNNESAFMKLAPKRRNFVECYFACEMNATQAAAKAGYSRRSARTQAEFLMKNPAVRAAIEEKRQEFARKNDVTPDWVVANAKKVVIRCMQEEPVYDKNGNPTGEYRFDSAGAVSALRILAKFLGMERSTIEHQSTGGLGIILNLKGNQP
ncbi:MAG: phage terminase small subunit [Clostridiales bacterium]|nr:phage terminase small subunit [Clostridiales bacterium]MDN5281530.1 phage terminase small subunit [Candidatus Ozemobacter sp.]